MGNSKSKGSEEKDFDDPLAVIVNVNDKMPTRRLLKDFIKLKVLWQPNNGIISKENFKNLSRIFQEEGVISPANTEVLEKCNELFSRKVKSSSSFSNLHWIKICKQGGFHISGRIKQLLGYPFQVPLFSGLIWLAGMVLVYLYRVLSEADISWTVWFWIIGLILACFLLYYIFTTSRYYFFPRRAVVVRDSPDGSAEEPSNAQDMPPPDHDQSCESQPHHEEDLDSSSINDSPDGSDEELSNTQNVQRYEEDFEIGKAIGEGGFGKVFEVQHKLDKKYYAIKEIKVTKRKSCFLQREITTLARLDHPNVVRYHQSWYGTEFQRVSQPPLQGLGSSNDFEGEDDGEEEEEEEEEEGEEQEGINSCLYIQMELCSGSLRKWLEDRNENVIVNNLFSGMNEKENQDIYKQMLEGMNYIHSQGIVHRDLTPKNIFLINKDDGHPLVKIGDFGLAREYRYVLTEPKTPMRFQRDQDLDKSSVDPDVSQTYTSGIGTETYAAPEQLMKGGKYNNKADMFSLGLILFELHHPFGTVMERCDCLRKLREGNFPEEFQERWPVQYSAIKCLTSKDSQERPSASDLLSGDMFPSKDKNIQILEEENKRLKKLIKQRDETADI